MGQSAEELRRDIEATRADLGETLDAIGDRVSPGRVMERRKNRITGAVRGARERVMGTVSNTGHMISDSTHSMAGSVRDGVSGTAGSATETVKEMPHKVTQQAQGSPLTAGALAFGVGFLAAAAFPASSAEQRMAGSVTDKMEPLKEGLSGVTHEIVDHLKEPAKEAADSVKQTAAEGAQEVKGAAQQGVEDTKQQAQSSVESVRNSS